MFILYENSYTSDDLLPIIDKALNDSVLYAWQGYFLLHLVLLLLVLFELMHFVFEGAFIEVFEENCEKEVEEDLLTDNHKQDEEYYCAHSPH